MKKENKFLALLLTVMMVFTSLPLALWAAAETEPAQEYSEELFFQDPPVEEEPQPVIEPDAGEKAPQEQKGAKQMPAVHFVNVDPQRNPIFSGHFRLEKKAGKTWKAFYYKGLESLTADGGNLTLKDLEKGSYRIIQTQAPQGYLLNSEAVEFTLPGSTGGGTLELSLVNSPEETVQNDITNDLPTLPEPEIDFENQTNPPLNDQTEDGGTQEITVPQEPSITLPQVQEPETENNELALPPAETQGETGEGDGTPPAADLPSVEVPPAQSIIVIPVPQPMPPQGLTPDTLDDEEQDPQENQEPETLPEEGENDPVETGKVLLTVTDKNKEPVKGAEFTIEMQKEDASWSEYSTAHVTNEAGQVGIENLPLGTYRFIQTAVPSGYVLNETPEEVKIEAGQTQDPVQVSFTNEKAPEEKGTVELTVKDTEGTPIAEAAFKLEMEEGENWNVVAEELTTDEKGQIKEENLPLGTYHFTQTAVPQGYVLDKTPAEVKIEAGQTQDPVQVSFTNEKAPEEKGSIELTVKDHQGAPVAGATFKLEQKVAPKGDSAKATDEWILVQDGLVSDAAGKVMVSDLSVGTYRFTQTAVPQGYHLNTTTITVAIEAGKTQTPVQAAFSNEKVTEETGSVELTLTDPNKQPVLGGTFKLEQKQADGSWKALQDNLVTNAQGMITVEKLPLGDYRFIQTKAAPGYILDFNPVLFSLKTGATQVPVKVTHVNRKELGSVELSNFSTNGSRLTGVAYTLEKKDESGTWKTQYDRLYSDAYGVILVQSLELGEYRLIQRIAPEGYQVDSTPIGFHIEAGKTATPVKLSKQHYPYIGSIQLRLTDRNGYPLSNGEFTLSRNDQGYREYYQGVGADGIALWTTNRNYAKRLVSDFYGNVYVNGLVADSYSFRQTKAPQGYQLNKTVVKITLNNSDIYSGHVPQKTMKNYLFGEIPPTGDETPLTALWIVAGVALVALITLVIVSQKQKKKKQSTDETVTPDKKA